MIFVERYYKIHRIFLTTLGFWPYQKSKILWIQTVFFFIVFYSFLTFQCTTFITAKCNNMECIILNISYILPTIVYALNYKCFFFNTECIKRSLEHIKLDWETLEDDNEMETLERYTFIAYIFTLIMFICFIFGISVFTMFECAPIVLDIIIPMNESRPRKIAVPLEFFIDEQQYFFWYLIHEIIGVLVGVWSTLVTGTFLATIGQHCCGTYKIASNLIRDTVTHHTLQIPTSQKIRFMYRNICRAVHIHNRTMQFMDGLLLSFHLWYFPLLIIGVISLSCNLFRLFNTVIRFNDFNEFSISFMMFIGHLIYMFLANFFGQLITDHSTQILKESYNTLWYIAPLPIQKLLLIMQIFIKDYKLVIGGFYVLSLEGFTTLTTSSFSYFTVLYAHMAK